MDGLTGKTRWIASECLRMYGALNVVEAVMEYEYAEKYHKLPDGARFLQEVIMVTDRDDDENCVFVWRDPGEWVQ